MTDTAMLDALEALILFHRDAGADLAIGEEPVDRFAEALAEKARRAAPPPRQVPERVQATVLPSPALAQPPEAAQREAREAAERAATLDELKAILEAFEGCALKGGASRTVFEDGRRGAPLMLVGEAPGREEDMEGKPFVGRSGQLLDRMLAAIDIDRTSAYIANVVPWRPPGNRTPTPQEIAVCEPFIRRQIELARPSLLVAVGAPAMQTLTGAREGITRMRGRFGRARFGALDVPTVAILHPAYLLRRPADKKFAWRDLLAIRRFLDGLGGTAPLQPE